MPTVAIVDDRKDQRVTIKRLISTAIGNVEWSVLDSAPLCNLKDYPGWISDNDVSVLILDERLDEEIKKSKHVNYKGHELVDFIRKRLPTLPIYIITSYAEDADLKNRFKDVEDIIKRRDFGPIAQALVSRMIRAGQHFLETFQKELSDLSDMSKKIAKGTATQKDMRTVKAISEKINMAFPSEVFKKNSDLVNELERDINKLEKLQKKTLKYLAKRKK